MSILVWARQPSNDSVEVKKERDVEMVKVQRKSSVSYGELEILEEAYISF